MAGARLDGRIALITGASRGIGAALACAYAGEGAHVVLVARTEGGLEEIDDEVRRRGGTATLVPLDLCLHDGIDQLAGTVFERWGRLDVLVGNAAMLGDLTPVGHIEPRIWESTFALNVTANWRLIRAFDPLLRQSQAGRAIFLTTGATRSLPPYWASYSASKAALEALVLTWARELEKTDVRVNLVNPGPTRTAMRAEAFPGEEPQSLRSAAHLAEVMLRLASPAFSGHGLWVAADQAGALEQLE